MQPGRVNESEEFAYIANEAMLREKLCEEKDMHRTTNYAYNMN